MKKILLFFIWISSFTTQAQQELLFNEDCETLTIGNIGTDISNTNPGQGGWFTSAITAENSDFQIANVGGINNNVIKIIGSSDGVTTNNKILDQFVGDFWINRTAGNNVAQIEFDFFTGPATTSKNFMRVALYDASKSKILAGIRIEMNTLKIKGLAYANVSGTLNNYSFSLGASDVVLTANTWYRFGFTFDYGTGDIRFKEVDHNLFNISIAGASANIPVSELFIFSTTQAGNTTSATGIFDTISFKADIDDTSLLSVKANQLSNKFQIIPNPAKNNITIENTSNSIDNISIYDLKGVEVKKIDPIQNLKNVEIDISNLSQGVYLIKTQSNKKYDIQKIVKE